MNPAGCKRALEAVIGELGLSLTVAMVEGDDVMPLTDALRADGMREACPGEPLPPRLLTANAYLGALPIKAAFDRGADIVITGRCADSALALGILMHEFGWAADDYDRLGAGSLVGHILECGPQATGGTFSDWERVPDWENIGYPIAECRADGSFIVSKPAGTGGLIEPAVIAEQTLYEIGDPAAYLLPDVVADFSRVRLTQDGPDRVRVEGARGRPPTSSYKVSSTYQDGYRAVATVSIVGTDAARKAERTGEALIQRARMLFARARHARLLRHPHRSSGRRGILRRQVRRPRVAGSAAAARGGASQPGRAGGVRPRIGSIGLSCAPGTTGIYSGRPKPTPVVRLFTFFLDKARARKPACDPRRRGPVRGRRCRRRRLRSPPRRTTLGPRTASRTGPRSTVPLSRLAYARSGDKGDSSNIAIIAREPRTCRCSGAR